VSVQRPEFPWERTARVPWEWMRDPNLSLKGKGLLAYLLSHAPGYTVSQGQMVRESTDGRDSVLTGLRELEAAGYLATRPLRADAPRSSGGQFVEHDYLLQDPAAMNPTPQPAPQQVSNGYRAGNPTVADFPSRSARDGESAPKGKKEEERKKRETPPTPLRGEEELFAMFWEVYPKKIKKQDARRAWAKAVKRTDAHKIIDVVERYPFDRNRPKYIPYPASWLNAGCWEDDLEAVAAAHQEPRSASGRNHWEPRERGTYTDVGDGTF
jgi:hypothetical protein